MSTVQPDQTPQIYKCAVCTLNLVKLTAPLCHSCFKTWKFQQNQIQAQKNQPQTRNLPPQILPTYVHNSNLSHLQQVLSGLPESKPAPNPYSRAFKWVANGQSGELVPTSTPLPQSSPTPLPPTLPPTPPKLTLTTIDNTLWFVNSGGALQLPASPDLLDAIATRVGNKRIHIALHINEELDDECVNEELDDCVNKEN